MQRNGFPARKDDGAQLHTAMLIAALVKSVLLRSAAKHDFWIDPAYFIRPVRSGRFAMATWLLFAWIPVASLLGCSSLTTTSDSIIRLSTTKNTARANRLTYAGIRALNKGEIELAAERFRDAISADMSYGPAHNNLGLMHYEQGNLYQAVMAFEEARQFLPNDPAVVYNLALALESAGEIDEALDLYYTAAEMDKANPHFLGNLCRLRVRMGHRDELLHHQLRELILIETRPEWRRWADMQLGIDFNDLLDRGPETPDFENSDESEAVNATRLKDKIIDLTPSSVTRIDEGPIESRLDDSREFQMGDRSPTDALELEMQTPPENTPSFDRPKTEAPSIRVPNNMPDNVPMPEPELMLKQVPAQATITDDDYYRP